MTRVRQARCIAVALALSAYACGSGDSESAPTPVAVLSAFPAELAAVLAHASIVDSVEIEGRVFRIGVLGGVPVVIGMTGIGLANATAITHALLERFVVAGVVVSGVAGSTLQIGDVTVPAAWTLTDGTTFTAHPPWLDLAGAVASAGAVTLESCTVVPVVSENPVCLSQTPAVVVGGVGRSADPFHGRPFPCQPGGGDLYGCDVSAAGMGSAGPLAARTPEASGGRGGSLRAAKYGMPVTAPAALEAPTVNDMETAAIAREAAARGLPFIAFRAVSDGAGDPLNLPTSLDQFGAYYHLAAHNAAAATVAFLERLRSS